MLVELTGDLKLDNGNVALLFYIPGHCAGCKKVISVLEDNDTSEWIIYKVNSESEEFSDLIKKYDIKTAPTLVVFKDEVQVDKIVGLKDFITKRKTFIK